MATVLICDDEKNIRRTLKLVISGEGHEVLEAERAESALRLLEEQGADVVLLDVKLPGMDGITALSRIRERWPTTEVIMISGHATVSEAAEATRRGAYDFFEKPLDRERVLVSLRNVLEKVRLARKVADLSREDEELLGESAAIREVKQLIAKVAPTGGRVLITGESGTGKELIARAIHRQSKRSDKPFVKVNCAAIPSELIESELFGHEKGAFSGATARKLGRFELADGGTIFLDEIGDMPLGAQAKVLRVLQNGEVTRVGGERTFVVDVRVLAATNKDLKAESEAGRFREDLFFRLNVVPIHAPPLRERPEDVERFLFLHGKHLTWNPAAREFLLHQYTHPFNFRGLRHLVERLTLEGVTHVGQDDGLRVLGGQEISSAPVESPAFPEGNFVEQLIAWMVREGLTVDSLKTLLVRYLEDTRGTFDRNPTLYRKLGISRSAYYRHRQQNKTPAG